MNVVLDATGAIQSLGETGSIIPPVGGSVLPTTISFSDAQAAESSATGPHDLVLDTSGATHKVVVRSRAKSAAELDADDRADLQTKLQTALDNWSTLTAAQKDALLKVCVRAALRAIR